MSYTDLRKDIITIKRQLTDNINRLSNIQYISHRNNASSIVSSDDGIFDISSTLSDLSTAIDDLSEMVASLIEEG